MATPLIETVSPIQLSVLGGWGAATWGDRQITIGPLPKMKTNNFSPILFEEGHSPRPCMGPVMPDPGMGFLRPGMGPVKAWDA